MNIAFQNIDWNFLNVMSTEKSLSKFQEILTDTLDKYTPMKDVKISQTKIIRNPWITTGSLKSSQTLDRLCKLKLDKPETIKYVNYIKYKNYYTKLKRIAKRQYFKDKLNLYKNDIRKTWNTLNNIIGRMNDESSISDILVIDGQQTSNHKSIANGFCDFTNVGKKFAEAIPHAQIHFQSYLNSNP